METKTIKYYEEYANQSTTRYESADVSNIQTLLLKTFKEKSSLLEIGCGSDRDASFMIINNYDVIGIDGF